MEEKYALVIIGIVALVGIISLNGAITGKFTETIYESYCNPAACKAACGKLCTEYTSSSPIGNCKVPTDIVNGKKKYSVWSCE